jgi:carbon monoxide dehydrogenase subunit G
VAELGIPHAGRVQDHEHCAIGEIPCPIDQPGDFVASNKIAADHAGDPGHVWVDPWSLASCIPGCHKLEPVGADRYRASLTVALAAITGSYEGTVHITDKIVHSSYRLTVEGQGKPGFVKGNAAIALRPDGAVTVVDVSGTVEAGGAIARLGQRLIGNVSKMMQDRFFACLQGKLS